MSLCMSLVIGWRVEATVQMRSAAAMHFNHAYLSAAGQRRFRHSNACVAAYTHTHTHACKLLLRLEDRL